MRIKRELETEHFCCECSLLEDALDTLGYIYKQKADNYASIAILCNEDLTEDIIKSLNIMCASGDIDLEIDYLDFDKDDYFDEYGIVLIVEDGQLKLSVEKAVGNSDYKLFDLDYVYIEKDCNDRLIERHLDCGCDMDLFEIDYNCEEDDFEEPEFKCDGDCENCELNEDEFADDESVDLYDVVESMVEAILEEKFTRK